MSFNIWRLERWIQAECSVWKQPTFAKQITFGVTQCWIQKWLSWLSEERLRGNGSFCQWDASYSSKPISQCWMAEMRLNVSIPLIMKEMKISWRMSRSRKGFRCQHSPMEMGLQIFSLGSCLVFTIKHSLRLSKNFSNNIPLLYMFGSRNMYCGLFSRFWI